MQLDYHEDYRPAPFALSKRPLAGRSMPLLALAGCAFLEAALQRVGCPTIAGDSYCKATIAVDALFVLIPFALLALSIWAASKGWGLPRCSPTLLPWLAGAACLLTGWLAGTFWPNSGDEHSYTFLADTFLAGRLSNPPAPDPELFKLYRVFTTDSQTFSQYPPGWPLVLAPFRAVGLDWLANPLLTVLLGACLIGAMRRLQIDAQTQTAALVLVLLSPFVLFNGGSIFSHMLSASLAAMIVWQQLADEQQPVTWRKILIGALFGLLLLTRYEAFAILAILFAAERLWCRRGAAFADAVPMLLGFFPFGAFCLGYNWAITGDPLQTPAALTNPDMTFQEAVTSLSETASRAVSHVVYWFGSLGLFGGSTLALLLIPALANKVRRRQVRFFDLAFPATILFFLYFPHDGGHQYGPRYWFFAWPLSVLTIITGLVASDGTFRLGGIRKLSFSGVVAANVVFCALILPLLIVTTNVYISARREVFTDVVSVRPAVVLVPSRMPLLWPWPNAAIVADSLDFARNDVNFRDPVLYGRSDAPDAIARACRLPGRTVFVWRGPGDLVRTDCHIG